MTYRLKLCDTGFRREHSAYESITPPPPIQAKQVRGFDNAKTNAPIMTGHLH